jgi:hypothetical protein
LPWAKQSSCMPYKWSLTWWYILYVPVYVGSGQCVCEWDSGHLGHL